MQPITVQEMFDYCLEGEHVFLAHVVYWCIANQVVKPTDDSNLLKEVEVDLAAVKVMSKQNLLGLKIVKLYVIKDTKEFYAFYFASNSLEASSMHHQLFGAGESIVEAPTLMHKLMYVEDIGDHVFLIDYRKRFVEFPVYIGHARAKEYTLQRMERQVSKVV